MVTKRARSRVWGLAMVPALALALAACGSSSSSTSTALDPGASSTPDAPSAHTVKPADGPVLQARGFSFHAPKGWADVSDHAATGVLLSAAHAADEQPLMITVRRVTPGPQSTGAARAAAKRLLARSGATHVEVRPDATIAGHPAAHVVGVRDDRGTHYQLDVYYVSTPRAGWALTFATDRFTTDSRREAMVASVLTTCRWHQA